MFLHVTTVQYLEGYTLRVAFTNGVIKQVNLQDELEGEIFEALQHPEIFKQVTVNPETKTLEWPNGADFAPEFLYEIGHVEHPQEEQPSPPPAMQPVPA